MRSSLILLLFLEIKCFFVSLFGPELRKKGLSDSNQYALRVCQAWKHDISKLDELKIDKRFRSTSCSFFEPINNNLFKTDTTRKSELI